MGRVNYIPERGDIIWLDFDQQTGREIKKRRPALVVSPKIYNRRTGLAMVCAITSKIKNYPFEVPIEIKGKKSAILCDHIHCYDYSQRNADFIKNESEEIIAKVQGNLIAIITG